MLSLVLQFHSLLCNNSHLNRSPTVSRFIHFSSITFWTADISRYSPEFFEPYTSVKSLSKNATDQTDTVILSSKSLALKYPTAFCRKNVLLCPLPFLLRKSERIYTVVIQVTFSQKKYPTEMHRFS